jgi:hypothetical protein
MDDTPLPKRVDSSTVVNGRSDQVFPLLETPYALQKWVTFLRQVQRAEGSGLGAQDLCQFRIGGMDFWAVAEVDVYEKSVRIGRTSVEGKMMMRSEFHLVPEGSNTRVRWAVSYRPPMGSLGSLLDVLIMRRAIRKGMTASLEGLRGLVESGSESSLQAALSDPCQASATGTLPEFVDDSVSGIRSLSDQVRQTGVRYEA